jgi:Protein of unknown function (DUF3040)
MAGAVPLSEHERRQLEQIEQALRASDPRLAGAAHATHPRVHYRRRVIGAALGFLSGIGLLFAGLIINVIPVAVAGFAVMLACSLWAGDQLPSHGGITTGRVPAQAARFAGDELHLLFVDRVKPLIDLREQVVAFKGQPVIYRGQPGRAHRAQ